MINAADEQEHGCIHQLGPISCAHHSLAALSMPLFLSSHPLSFICSAVLSCFLHFPLPFSVLFTLPCSASMLPWQRTYRISLLPRPRKSSSFQKGRKDGEIWRESRGIQLRLHWRCCPHLFRPPDTHHLHQSNSRLHMLLKIKMLIILHYDYRVNPRCFPDSKRTEVEWLIVDDDLYLV